MQEVNIHELMERCVKYFEDHCYTESRIYKYKSLWRTGITRYMFEHNINLTLSPCKSWLCIWLCCFVFSLITQKLHTSIETISPILLFKFFCQLCNFPRQFHQFYSLFLQFIEERQCLFLRKIGL